MSSIMRARSGLTGRFEDWEVIGGSSLKPKVAGPSMLGIGCPNRHAFLFTRSPTPPENPPTSTPPSRESGFVHCRISEFSAPGCEGSFGYRRPYMRFVSVKLVGQEAALSQHRVEQSRAFVRTGSHAGFRQ